MSYIPNILYIWSMKTKDGRKRTPDTQQEIRNLIVENRKKGISPGEIAEMLGITRRAEQRVWKQYKEKGRKGILLRKRGRKSEKAITGQQESQIKKMIENKLPDQLKLPFGLWTREGVGDLIYRQFGVRVSKWTVGRYLKDWGFSPQKPIAKAYEQDPDAVEKWLKQDYPALQVKAKKEKADISWGDETGMRSDHQAGRTYAVKGQTPVIMKTGKRFKINMISAINNRGLLKFMIFKEGFNTKLFIKFMGRMIERSERKILLIVDGHPSHKTLAVKDWIIDHKNQIELFYLPGYSPELNPDEYLNQDIKTNAVGKKRPINQSQLRKNVRSFLKKKQSDRSKVAAYFRAKHVQYAA